MGKKVYQELQEMEIAFINLGHVMRKKRMRLDIVGFDRMEINSTGWRIDHDDSKNLC